MNLESTATRFLRIALSTLAIAAVHWIAVAWALHEPPISPEESQTGGAFIIELAQITTSPDDERRDIAVGQRSDEVAPVEASTPQQAAVVEPQPVKDEPVVPETREPPPEDAVQKRPDEKPPEEEKPEEATASQAEDAPAVAPVAASEAAAPQKIENAEKKSDVSQGQNAGITRVDRRAIKNWHGDVIAHINRHKRFPARARDQSRSGIVSISFSMDRGGRVLHAEVAKSSGFDVFDSAAIEMLKRASPLPVPPDVMEGESFDFIVPINFRMRS